MAIPSPADEPMMPVRPGTVLGRVPVDKIRGAEDLTDSEIDVLRQAGWKDGDPVPDLGDTKIGQQLRRDAERIRQEAADLQGEAPVNPATPPLTMPEAVPLETLSVEKQHETLQAMDDMSELKAQLEAAKAAKAAAQEVPTGPGGFRIIDDLPKDEAPAPVAIPPVQEPEPENSSQEQNSEPAKMEGECPMCGLDLATEPNEPTVHDKMAYIAVVLGDLPRFRKTVSLYGGRLQIVFRSLLPREVDLALKEADIALNAGDIMNIGHYARVTEAYKMCMSIAEVRRPNKQPIQLPEIDKFELEEGEETALPRLNAYLENEVFTVESIRRAVFYQYTKFNNMLNKLEVRADDPDFFEGIELPA